MNMLEFLDVPPLKRMRWTARPIPVWKWMVESSFSTLFVLVLHPHQKSFDYDTLAKTASEMTKPHSRGMQ